MISAIKNKTLYCLILFIVLTIFFLNGKAQAKQSKACENLPSLDSLIELEEEILDTMDKANSNQIMTDWKWAPEFKQYMAKEAKKLERDLGNDCEIPTYKIEQCVETADKQEDTKYYYVDAECGVSILEKIITLVSFSARAGKVNKRISVVWECQNPETGEYFSGSRTEIREKFLDWIEDYKERHNCKD